MGFSVNSGSPVSNSTIQVKEDDNRENLKKTLQDPNTSTQDTLNALGKLYQMNGAKVVDGTASDEEKNEHQLIESLRSGNISGPDREKLTSQLGISAERLAEIEKRYKSQGEEQSGVMI